MIVILWNTSNTWRPLFFGDDKVSEFIRNVVSVFLSAIVGIPAGMWLNRIVEDRRKKTERIEFLKSLSRMIGEAIEHLDVMEDYIDKKKSATTVVLNTKLLDSSGNYSDMFVCDKSLYGDTSLLHYEMWHINERTKASMQFIASDGGETLLLLKDCDYEPSNERLPQNKVEVLRGFLLVTLGMIRQARKICDGIKVKVAVEQKCQEGTC